jgi:hypothetical protein
MPFPGEFASQIVKSPFRGMPPLDFYPVFERFFLPIGTPMRLTG